MPTNNEVFLCGYDYVGKADLGKGYWNPKKKIGGNLAFIRDNSAAIILKSSNIQSKVWRFFPN